MNRVLVRKCAAGLAAYLGRTDASVVIGHDARTNSRAFAEDSARVFAGAGLRVYLAPRPWPTPVTAWCVSHFGAAAGVMVTASHNPRTYNGYKVYWGNGAQIIPPHDAGIAAAIARVGRSDELPMAPLDDPHITHLGEDTHDRYVAAVVALRPRPELDVGKLVVAYTPMHGVGVRTFEPAMARAGFAHVHVEPSQREPDPAFPTVAFPNPEEKGAMDRVVALGTRVSADVVLANDPDADRLCCAVRDGRGGFQVLTGDQVGALLADYLLEVGPADKRVVATTIVSSQLVGFLAARAGADYRETLTGFKWIANAALDYERETGGRFVMGYEEAIGYTVGSTVRDKDGISAAIVFAELVAWNRARGRGVLDHLDDIYRRVGLFVTEQVSLTKRGLPELSAMMARVRTSPPRELAGVPVESIVDLARGDGGLPPSDVLVLRLGGGRRVIMRPSGTEPKLKSYYEVRVEVVGDEPVAAARVRGVAELAAIRDAHQRLLTA